jgi:hypothetical protein
MFINKAKCLVLVLLACVLFSALSVGISYRFYATDFPLYYYAASTIVDENAPREAVYEIDYNNKYNIPEIRPSYLNFMYSISAAYLLAPLALMPYYIAKSVMIYLNICLYLGGVLIALRHQSDSYRGFIYPLAFSVFWLPFITTLAAGQINGLLVFLVSAAVFSATKNKPVLCGLLLGVAALFKLFPVAIAMVLGVRDWRIFVACILLVLSSFLVPGSWEWFRAIGNIYLGPFKDNSFWVSTFGALGYVCYASVFAMSSAFIVFRSRHTNYYLMASFAIPTTFLVMPSFLYYHLALLIIPLLYLWSHSDKIMKSVIIIYSLLMYTFYEFGGHQQSFPIIVSLFAIWGILAVRLIFKDARMNVRRHVENSGLGQNN